MNWPRILANIAAAAAACFTAHSVMGGSLAAGARPEALLSMALCVASNLAGLFQRPPRAAGASAAR